MMPARITAERKLSQEPSTKMDDETMTVSPAAGPLTPSCDPLNIPTKIPPTIPEIKPAIKGALEARAIPKHKGSATKKTTILEDKSDFKVLNIMIISL